MSQPHRFVLAAAALLALALPLRATWSIILVDTRTGEVAIGSATCLTRLNLLAITPVVLVNCGAAAAQASVNVNSVQNRLVIWNLLQRGVPPADILAALAAQDPGHQTRQYGIVDVQGRAVTFSGSSNAAWAGGVTGSVGTIHYAIQGNILTGQAVVLAAEAALRNTPGDLAERLMASMEAARSMGGDGRCSCSQAAPTSCGAPPASFVKSAHIGYMVVARQGDRDGTCSAPNIGCASGSYWMNLNVAGQSGTAPDPVLQLRTAFDAWRVTLAGRPDHHLSTVQLDPPSLIPDGSSTAIATVTLRDWQGNPLTSGGAVVRPLVHPATTAQVRLGPVTDHGNGTYSFPVTAGNRAGTVSLRVTVDDGTSHVLLSPATIVPVRQDALWASSARVSAAAGGAVDLALRAGGAQALRAYAVAASASGNSPGIPLAGGAVLPLNPDPLFSASLAFANSAVFVRTVGTLDFAGNATARFAPAAGALAPLLGTELHFAYALLSPLDFASNAVPIAVAP
jgi:uncharacterized Ntn-hydrolase superfamily protein